MLGDTDSLFEQGSDYLNFQTTFGRVYIDGSGLALGAPGGALSLSGASVGIVSSDFNIDLGSDATGDVYYRNSSNNLARLPIGTSGQVLTVSGGGLPSWTTASGGATPAGANYNLQYYNSGALGADSKITVTPGSQPKLAVGSTSPAATLHAKCHNDAGSATILAENNSGNDIIKVLSSGYIQLGDNETTPRFWQSTYASSSPSYTADGFTFRGQITSSTSDVFGIYHAASAVTTAANNIAHIVGSFNPSSGSATYTGLRITQTIDQTGTANGDTYGIIIDPTLTTVGAGGYYSIFLPTNNASAYGIYQDGALSPNFFAGKVGINDSTPSSELEVSGTTKSTKFVGNSSTPTYTLGSSSIVGTGAACSVVGTDAGVEVTLTTGTSISSVGTMFTITFSSAYSTNAPVVVFSPSDLNAATYDSTIKPYVSSTSTSAFNLSNISTLTASTTYKWSFHIIGK